MNETKNGLKLGIRGRLWLGFMTIIASLLIMVGISLNIINATKTIIDQSLKIDLPSYDSLFVYGSYIREAHTEIHKWLLTGNALYKNEKNIWNDKINPLKQQIDDLSKNWNNSQSLTMWQQIKEFSSQLQTLQIELLNSNYVDVAKDTKQINELDILTEKIIDLINGQMNPDAKSNMGITDIQYQLLETSSNKIIDNMSNIQKAEYVLSFFVVFISILIAYLTIRSIIKQINVFRQHSSRVAAGDLRQHITLETNDEIGLLGHDLNRMTDSLSNVTKLITEACHNMVSSLEEVKQSVDMQSTGATEQASSINEITVSLEEIEKSSTQTMGKAKDLGDIAERTREKGQLGLEAVEQSIRGMKLVRDKVQLIAQTILDLSNQTQQIGEITSVVNTLAQQSKMLALNASIEAAKAGEAGKGFAVVASEVKNLAEQSEQSTTQVQKILEDIRRATEKAVMVTEEGTKGVDQGTSLVEQTGEVVRSLSDVIHEATIASQQIEAAVRQEGTGIEQITAGMNEINQVTSSFVASVKQTTEAINNLAAIAKTLKDQVDTYKIL